MSTDPPLNPLTARRRPLSSTNVRCEPSPRNDADDWPAPVLPSVDASVIAPVVEFAARRSTNAATLCMPWRSISAAVIT